MISFANGSLLKNRGSCCRVYREEMLGRNHSGFTTPILALVYWSADLTACWAGLFARSHVVFFALMVVVL